MFKAQKDSKNIVKIVPVSSVVQSECCEAMRILLCTMKIKIILNVKNLFSFFSVFDVRHDSTTVCMCGAADVAAVVIPLS